MRWLCIALALCLTAAAGAQETLRGRVVVELEPPQGIYATEATPPDHDALRARALEQARLFFSAQIYGWAFKYDIGERARGLDPAFAWEPRGDIGWGDPGLRVTDAEFLDRGRKLACWVDFRPNESQARRLQAWTTGAIRSAQATGVSEVFGGLMDSADWPEIRRSALEDAAEKAVRALLRGSERNRPQRARGLIALRDFPTFALEGGRWTCKARFRVDIQEITGFGAY